MPIYTGSKGPPGALYPSNAIDTELGRLEPLLTADQLKSRFLKGISMVLKVKDPETGLNFRITNEELTDYISIALEEAEVETGLSLIPTKYKEKLPYQRLDWEQLGYFQLPRRPISSIDLFSVRLSDGNDVFQFPLEWLETSNLIWGQLNVIPLAFQNMLGGGTGIIGGAGTGVYFNNLWQRPWVAAMFGVEYTTGFPDGNIPKFINSLVGAIAAMQVLSLLGAAGANNTSVSLGLDGASQSTSGPGPNKYQLRMQELAAQRKLLVKKAKKMFGTAFVIGTV